MANGFQFQHDLMGTMRQEGLAHESHEWHESRHFCREFSRSAGWQPALGVRIRKTPGKTGPCPTKVKFKPVTDRRSGRMAATASARSRSLDGSGNLSASPVWGEIRVANAAPLNFHAPAERHRVAGHATYVAPTELGDQLGRMVLQLYCP